MAKKFVRGVTGIEDIESYDKTLTNVNDILSDGQDTYVHTKKGKTESYYKLTDSLKSVTSDNSELITVTKDDTTNTATIHPKHDAQKEQVIESTRGTVSIQKGSNGTNTTTKVDTNPQKVLEHENLLTDYGITKSINGNNLSLQLKPSMVDSSFDVNTFFSGKVVGENVKNSPTRGWFVYDNDSFIFNGRQYTIQTASRYKLANVDSNEIYKRTLDGGVWSTWLKQVSDLDYINNLLAQKQNTLASNASVAVISNTLRQLYALKQTYTNANGLLKTYVKSISENTNINNPEEEFNFIVKINKGAPSVNFTLNSHDTTKFQNIITSYGADNTVSISGCVFTLSGSTLTVSTTNNTAQNYVVTFSDII